MAFAGNSILARMAMAEQGMDAASFTAVRLLAGAAVLAALLALRTTESATDKVCWKPSLALFAYAVAFSFAYVSLSTGTGALILFAAVQLTMLLSGFLHGERLTRVQGLGLVVALGGLAYLLSPGLQAPSLIGAVLMLASGVAWGLYSLMGRSATDPVRATTWNFLRAAPLGLMLALLFWWFDPTTSWNVTGVLLAIISGAVTSGLGYVLWYAALPALGATQAATVQLTVPVIAAFGGVSFLDESLSLRLVGASTLILGGVGMTLRRRT